MALDQWYCKHCRQDVLPAENGCCPWCDHPFGRVKHRRADLGKARMMDDAVVERAWDLYQSGLSLRRVAAQLLPDTGYASDKVLANRLCEQFKTNGWQTRDRIEATVSASWKHGLSRRKHKDPAHRHNLRVASGDIRGVMCKGVTTKGVACLRPALAGGEFCIAHDPERREQLLTWIARGREVHAANRVPDQEVECEEGDNSSDNRGGIDPRGRRNGHAGAARGDQASLRR